MALETHSPKQPGWRLSRWLLILCLTILATVILNYIIQH